VAVIRLSYTQLTALKKAEDRDLVLWDEFQVGTIRRLVNLGLASWVGECAYKLTDAGAAYLMWRNAKD
jgi:hypothetical protein